MSKLKGSTGNPLADKISWLEWQGVAVTITDDDQYHLVSKKIDITLPAHDVLNIVRCIRCGDLLNSENLAADGLTCEECY